MTSSPHLSGLQFQTCISCLRCMLVAAERQLYSNVSSHSDIQNEKNMRRNNLYMEHAVLVAKRKEQVSYRSLLLKRFCFEVTSCQFYSLSMDPSKFMAHQTMGLSNVLPLPENLEIHWASIFIKKFTRWWGQQCRLTQYIMCINTATPSKQKGQNIYAAVLLFLHNFCPI